MTVDRLLLALNSNRKFTVYGRYGTGFLPYRIAVPGRHYGTGYGTARAVVRVAEPVLRRFVHSTGFVGCAKCADVCIVSLEYIANPLNDLMARELTLGAVLTRKRYGFSRYGPVPSAVLVRTITSPSDKGTHFHSNGHTKVRCLVNVVPAEPEWESERDEFDDWIPFAEGGWNNDDAAAAASVSTTASAKNTRTRYLSSDNPMLVWRKYMSNHLDELLRGKGLGRHHQNPTCASCRAEHCRVFRCRQCGPFLQCETCLRARHAQLPLHSVQVWTGGFWAPCSLYREPSAVTTLAMEYQLGHHGFACPRPEGRQRTLVVMSVSGIVEVDVRFCACSDSMRHPHGHLSQLLDNGWYPATPSEPATCATFELLDLFRLLKVVGNMNAHDFVGSLERLTNTTFTAKQPDHYKSFLRMSRQYNFFLMAKRAGRGHQEDGVGTTPPGGLMVPCWACPDPARNLPPNWEAETEKSVRLSVTSFLYALMLALDANFRLKNRLRKNERSDPSLTSGFGYFVASGPYKAHLRDYVAESDISTCIVFAALMQKETRLTEGLRVSGVGGCVCARHGVVRPRGIGDLQKGERYANMDWIFLSALGGSSVKQVVVSYDIACQWKQHIAERAKIIAAADHERATTNGRPDAIITNLGHYRIQHGLPVWHAAAHESSCQAANSLSHAVGVGRTDGEGIERTWAVLNPIAYSTKEMGEGNRQDTIEDKIDHINWEKNVRQANDEEPGDTLARKIVIAIAERNKQVEEFVEVDRTVEPSLRKEWVDRIETWNRDPSKPNPYEMKGKHGPTEAQILADLKKTELEDIRAGRSDVMTGKMTGVAFIKGALQLEDLQLMESRRRIAKEVRGTQTLTAERSSQLDELRAAFFKKLRTWEMHQEVFMPGVAIIRARAEEERDPDAPAAGGGRNANTTGQHASTRWGTLIERMGGHIAADAQKYHQARAAGLALNGDFAPHFKELKDDDMRVQQESESDARARAALGKLGSTRRARNEPSVTKKMLPISWIWFAEEVELLREEMCRVLRSLNAVRNDWESRVSSRSNVDGELAAGLAAYAKRQVYHHERIAGSFEARWRASAVEGVRRVVQEERERMLEEGEDSEVEDVNEDIEGTTGHRWRSKSGGSRMVTKDHDRPGSQSGSHFESAPRVIKRLYLSTRKLQIVKRICPEQLQPPTSVSNGLLRHSTIFPCTIRKPVPSTLQLEDQRPRNERETPSLSDAPLKPAIVPIRRFWRLTMENGLRVGWCTAFVSRIQILDTRDLLHYAEQGVGALLTNSHPCSP
ncbi:hypothetical protein C8F01DRAFT_1083346 [Mycena amicta]|nr:hypothetical protein C8F01DRAFT_1083346 [Mycena amicta]